jgi:hypothetical protein
MRIGLGTVLLAASIALNLHAQQPTAPPVNSGNEIRGAKDSFVEVHGGRLYYEECGTGTQTVELIHDGVVDSQVWNDVWPDFCRHFHTVRYDRRGFGRSPAATTWYACTRFACQR